jgi:hypothetical protein
MLDSPFVFRNRLLNTALHLDYLRLRCGLEARFEEGIEEVRQKERASPHVFAALSEWDAVIILPCQELYPEALISLYANRNIATSISGSAGYFAYVWEHEVNVDPRHDLDSKLAAMAGDGIGIITSLRFEDHTRRELGLGAELLFCDYLQRELALPPNEGVSAVVAHTLGWNDAVVLLHTTRDEKRLLSLLSEIRLLTVEKCIGAERFGKVPRLNDLRRHPMFAASYSHLVGGHNRFLKGNMGLGTIAKKIVSARVYIRAIPSLEAGLRKRIFEVCSSLGVKLTRDEMPSEMGHYSFSVPADELARSPQASDLLKLILTVRRHIGEVTGATSESYAETSTRLRFSEIGEVESPVLPPSADPDVRKDLELVADVLEKLPTVLRGAGASAMTVHRFNAVLLTLLDNLADPVRSSVVRHLTRFMLSVPTLIPGLDRDAIDDLCHVCEYAVTQATDGIVQFQHDATSLGLTGRGGYSRLILAMETYMQDLFSLLGIREIVPLLTFGLRTGRGSTARFQTDVPFKTVFVPSSWYILVHEAAHRAWITSFGWLGESLATYEALEHAIRAEIAPETRHEAKEQTLIEFIRTREIVRELFPNYLVYKVACGGDLSRFDKQSLTHILAGRPGGGTREVLIAVVLHCLLKMMDSIGSSGSDWWSHWELRRKENHKSLIQDAIDSLDAAMKAHVDETVRREKLKGARVRRGGMVRTQISTKQRLLKTEMFHESVDSALQSVLAVLDLSRVEFGREAGGENSSNHAAQSALFTEFQGCLERAAGHLTEYEAWMDRGFAEWLASGEVLALAPPGWAWSKLLLDSRDVLESYSSTSFLLSQLSVILSLFHRSVMPRDNGGKRSEGKRKSSDQIVDVLAPLGLVERKGLA